MGAAFRARPARVGQLPALLALAAAGGGLGFWIWVRGTPRARVPVPGGEVAYLHGQPAWSLAGCIALGLGAIVVVVVVLGALIAAWQPRPGPDGVRPTLWLRETAARLPEVAVALLPATLLGLVALTWWLPLGLLSGPVSVLLDDGNWAFLAAVLLTLGASVGRLLRPSGASPVLPGHGPVMGRIAAVVFAVVAVANLALLPRATLIGPTGDEPDYLLLAHSLVVDRDLDLRNQVEQRDYRLFTARLQPHVREGPFGGLYTAHRPGLPLLVAPAYGFGLWTGWPVRVAVMVELCLLAAWLAARLATWASGLTGDVASAVLAALLVAFTAPGFYYAFAIYPELPAALVVLEVLAWIGRGAPGAGWGSGLLIAGLPWLHEKFVPLSVTLAVLGAVTAGGRRRTLAGLIVPLGVSAVFQAFYYWKLYGAPIPSGVHAGFASWSTLHQGLVGLWVDRDHGLLALAPVFLVAAAGIPALWRAAPRLAGSAFAAGLSLYLVVGVYREWWGGFAPPPRYLVPLLPVLGLALAFGLREWRRRVRGLRAALLGATSVAVAAAAVITPALQYRHAHPVRSSFLASIGPDTCRAGCLRTPGRGRSPASSWGWRRSS